jgi:hypothetical protein
LPIFFRKNTKKSQAFWGGIGLTEASELVFYQFEARVVIAVVVFFTAGITRHRTANRANSLDDCKATRTGIGMLALQPAAFEREGMPGVFSCNPQLATGGLPFDPMRINPPARVAFICHEMGKLMFQGSPHLGIGQFPELGIDLDLAGWPPCTACGRPHARIPDHRDFSRQLGKPERSGLLLTPDGHSRIGFSLGQRRVGFFRGRSRALHPLRESEFELREKLGHRMMKICGEMFPMASMHMGRSRDFSC